MAAKCATWGSLLHRRGRVRFLEVLRGLPERVCFGVLTSGSGVCEHPTAQQIEPGASIHVALDDLEPIDLTLDLAVAPGLRQCSAHRILVATQAGGERRQGAGLRLQQPVIERAGDLVLDHRREAAGEIDGGGDGGRVLQQGSDELTVVVAEFVGVTGQKANLGRSGS